MQPRLIKHLLSFNNKFNIKIAASFPVHKFHNLYEEKSTLTDSEKKYSLFMGNEDRTGFYVINEHLLSLFAKNSIYFAPSSQLNDPWDAGGVIKIFKLNSTIEDKVLEVIFSKSELQEIEKLSHKEKNAQTETKIGEIFSSLRFACFTKRIDSPPMWAHYADNHKGVCLVFQFMQKLPKSSMVNYSVDPNFASFYPIRYSNEFTEIKNINEIGTTIEVLRTKNPDWSYEQEVRYIALCDPNIPNQGISLPFYKSSLTKVILGHKVPYPVLQLVGHILEKHNYSNTSLIKASFNKSSQRLEYILYKKTLK